MHMSNLAGGRTQSHWMSSTSEAQKRPLPLCCVLLLLLLFCFRWTEAGDRLLRGQFLSGNQTIVSKGGVFELGFFQPESSLPRYYIGIWVKPDRTGVINPYWYSSPPVWVANREHPVFDPSSSQFRISDDGGSLVVLSNSKTAWSSSDSAERLRRSADNSTWSVVVLEDTGNLVLKQFADAVVVWQSFDHLTDTWLPGSLIGRNKVTGETRKLVSWTISDDPSPGPYSLCIDPLSDQLTLWNGSHVYWSSGEWNGRQFSGIPEFFLSVFTKSSNLRSSYYKVIETDIISRFSLDSDGQLILGVWQNELKYWNDIWNLVEGHPIWLMDRPCGPFSVWEWPLGCCKCLEGFQPVSSKSEDWPTAGCVRKTPIWCGSRSGGASEEDSRFKALPNIYLLSTRNTFSFNTTEPTCKSACDGCLCTAYAFNDGICSIWFGNLSGFYQPLTNRDSGLRLYIGDATADFNFTGNEKHRYGKSIMISIGAVSILLAVLSCWACWRARKARILQQKLATGCMVMFPYHLLQSATKNFSEELGRGGFGSVFRGMLPDATAIAVKKLELKLHQGEKQFRAEVSTLVKVQHVNLVRLRGFCCRGAQQRLLVYEYMPNGSLDRHLFRRRTVMLGWDARYRIMLGVARGLAYLHEDCRDGRIVHCDIKPENILLDADFSAKVADFGMAKLIGRDFSRALTTMRGTRGYLAPEWISGLPITAKADVYSYGMMLFEVVSGKRNSCDFQVGDDDVYWPVWAATRVSQGQTIVLLDPRLEGDFDTEELERVCRLACWCIQDLEDDRPSMRLAVQILEGTFEVGVPPVPESLLHLLGEDKTVVYSTESSSFYQSQAANNSNGSGNARPTTTTD